MCVMQQAIEECGHRGGVPEELAPIIHRPIRRQQRRRPFVTAHDQLEEIFGGRVRELTHAEVIDDQQRHGRQFREIVLPRARQRRFREFLEQRVGLTVDDALALQNGGTANRLCQVALAGAGRAEEEDVLALGDEARRGELVDERAVHFLVEIKIKGVE